MVNLFINERHVGDVTVLDVKGRVHFSNGSMELHKAVKCLVGEGKTQILLNLATVMHIDSGGLGELMASHMTLESRGGEIKLLHLTESLRELMVTTKLLTILDVYDDEAEAVASFASGNRIAAVS